MALPILKLWQKYVVDNGLDIGLLMMVMQIKPALLDHKGNGNDGDKIGDGRWCKYLKEQGRLKDDTVVTTVMSNPRSVQISEREGMKYEQTAKSLTRTNM